MVEALEEVFTPKEVATTLKLSEKTVLQYLREGRLPGFRIGKHWRVKRADLAAIVQSAPHPVLVAPADPEPEPAHTAAAAHTPIFSDQRRAILTLLHEHPEGLSPVQTRQRLGTDKDLGQTMKAMARDGWLRRLKPGVYTVDDTYGA
jgi:excisionase family DNA binding protein